MPIVLKRHGFRHSYNRHLLRDLSAESAETPPSLERLPVDADVQLHGTLVLSAGLFLIVLVGYLFRRQIRSVPSRVAHAISVHGTPLNLIHIHLHTLHYSPLNDHDTNADIESSPCPSPVHEEDEPAPPYYSAPLLLEHRSKEKERKHLQITVPPRPTFTRPTTTEQFGQLGASHGPLPSASSNSRTSSPSTPSLFSDAGSSSSASSPVPSLSTPVSTTSTLIDASFPSKASVLNLASPRASRWDAFSRPFDSSSTGNNGNRASILSGRSDILSTDSPCATPPPQYTITIHSSPRSRNNSESEGGPPVPDIILSPVPWMPREYAQPPSPPCYLSVPSRKSKSRVLQSSSTRAGASEKEKPLPPSPQQECQHNAVQKQQSLPSKFITNVEIKQRHASLNDISAKPTSTSSSSTTPPPFRQGLPLGFNAPRRSATLPVQQQRSILPPAPQPILPIDLEAVYPTSPIGSDNNNSDKGSEEEDSSPSPWLWRSRSPAPSQDKDRHFKVAGDVKTSGTEKTQYNEKECSSDSDDIPLAQGLVLAMRRRRERSTNSRGLTSPVSQVFKKQFLGRLSALAAKARSAIEHEFDSSEDEEADHHDEQPPPHNEKAVLAHHNFIQREMQAVDTFIIGDEE